MHIVHPEEKEEGKEGGKEEEEVKTSSIENRPISITGTFKCIFKFLLCFCNISTIYSFFTICLWF